MVSRDDAVRKLQELDRRVGKYRDQGKSVPAATVKAVVEMRRDSRKGSK
jgi:hypothetical protein